MLTFLVCGIIYASKAAISNYNDAQKAMEEGNYEKAIISFEKAISIVPNDGVLRIGMIYFDYEPNNKLRECMNILAIDGEILAYAVVAKSQNLPAYNEVIEGFTGECIKNNILIRAIYDLKGKTKIGHKIAKRIKTSKPDIVLTTGVMATTIMKDAIEDIPIIFCMVINYERFELSGPNITGIPTEVAIEKQFMGYRSLLDSIQNVGIIYDISHTGNIVKRAEQKMNDMGINLVKYEIKSSEMVTEALNNLIGKIDALWVLPDSTVVTKKSFEHIKRTALDNNIPLLCTSKAFVKTGALAAVFPDYNDIGRQSAQIAKELQSIDSVRSLGIVYPEKFKLAINSDSAERLGLNLDAIREETNVTIYP